MNTSKATVQNGQVLVKVPVDWPEGSEVVITWSAPVGATPPLRYEELRSVADRFPPPAEWYAKEDDLF
jgi:hypothetical protein